MPPGLTPPGESGEDAAAPERRRRVSEDDEEEEEEWAGASSFLPTEGSGFQDLLRHVGGGRALKQLRESEKLSAATDIEQSIFQRFDADGSGTIDTAEVKQMLSEYGLGDMEDEGTQAIFSKYDADNSGFLDFDEFRRLVKELQLIAAEKKVFQADISRLKARIRDQGRGLLHPRGQFVQVWDMISAVALIWTMCTLLPPEPNTLVSLKAFCTCHEPSSDGRSLRFALV